MNLHKSKTAKFVAGFVAFAFAFSLVVTPVSAQTNSALEAQIAQLLAQIAALQGQVSGSAPAGHTFNVDLTLGSTGADVVALQTWLVSKGFLTMPAGVAMGTFGPLTQSAVAAWQASAGISPAAGYVGPITRARLNASAPSTPSTPNTPNTPSTPGVLQGGAGSIEDADFVSSINNEEVGEDEEDVQVAGLEIEADDGSDLEITAVRLDFDAVSAGSDFEDYASEVSLWLDGDEIARLDADEFTDNNNFDKTISVDSGAVINAGDTGELVVAVSGINNLDSDDAADTWTVIFSQVRVVDAQGASVTETATGDIGTETRQFSFESFASAVNTEFKITEGDDEINDGQVIQVDANGDSTDEVAILAYDVEIEGDGDVSVDDLSVGVLVTGATDIDDVISGLTLFMDGEEVGSADMDGIDDTNGVDVGTYEPFLFDDMDLNLEAGETYEFVVKADLFSTDTAGLDEGDTITASTTATLLERAGFADIEDESGEDLAATDISGSAAADTHSIYSSGISVEFVSADAEITSEADDAGEQAVGTYEITFKVTAFDNAIYLDRTVTRDDATAGGTAGDGFMWATTTESTTGTTSLSAIVSASDTDSDDTTTKYIIDEGDERTFTMQVLLTASQIDGSAGMKLTAINWTTDSTDATPDNFYTTNLNDFKTGQLTLLTN